MGRKGEGEGGGGRGKGRVKIARGRKDLILILQKKAATFQLPEEIQLPTEESYVTPGKYVNFH